MRNLPKKIVIPAFAGMKKYFFVLNENLHE